MGVLWSGMGDALGVCGVCWYEGIVLYTCRFDGVGASCAFIIIVDLLVTSAYMEFMKRSIFRYLSVRHTIMYSTLFSGAHFKLVQLHF